MDNRKLDRIRILSTRFHELQGLRVALTGVCLALVIAGYLMAAPHPTNNGAVVAMLAAFLPVAAAMPRLNRYYADHFGRQVWKRPKNVPYLMLFLSSYWILGFYLNSKYPEIPSGAPTLVTVALASIAVAIRDWPWRSHYLAVTAAVAIAFKATASGGGTLPANLTVGILFIAVGVSMVLVGLLDHFLLVKLVKESREPVTAS